MSRTIPHLLAKGTKVVDLTEKSWHRNAKSIAAVVKRIQEANIDALTVLVHDLFGNTSVRFCQADDTLSLAVKLPGEGGWHLMGDAISRRTHSEKPCKYFHSSDSALLFWGVLFKRLTRGKHT